MPIPQNIDPLHCATCGYDVRGLPTSTCPECGSDLNEVGTKQTNAFVKHRSDTLHNRVLRRRNQYGLIACAIALPFMVAGFWAGFTAEPFSRGQFWWAFCIIVPGCLIAYGVYKLLEPRVAPLQRVAEQFDLDSPDLRRPPFE